MSDYDIPEEDDYGPFHVEHLPDMCAVYDSFEGKYTLYFKTANEAKVACSRLEMASQISHNALDRTYQRIREEA